ncbi:ATP-binding protein [Siphonobacter sp. SORGH_AS_0500]|uniref:sensor histidine kinase n=1 Tax=Siphonobacter sp. SORGH_AS_0500 TaxID=1864824 RepID=UPI000CA730A0|nr:HAMP domain-containing sensor histidine kinase [Siphonobacter sp. SORGH_AS_0500]MDR6193502.1 light-regulated signal transduction histidine kinase (bacteriophytochrome) [Siphonobacter sp. SORGH_AS_0500]PKK36368.1 hypothetical protein BWI96_10895 [Siphonobacter sp. SORGH_AS_0500]
MNHSDTKETAGFITVSSSGMILDFSYHLLQITGLSAIHILDQPLDLFLLQATWERLQAQPTGTLTLLNPEITCIEFHYQIHETRLADQKTFQITLKPKDEERQPASFTSLDNDWLLMNKIFAHDLREPLRKILLYIDMIRGNTQNQITAESLMLLQVTNDQSYQALQLLDSIRQYTSFATNEKRTLKSIDLNEMVEKSWLRVSDENGLNTTVLEKTQLPVIKGQGTMIQTLFYQLLDNSAKFAHPSRPLQIRIEAELHSQSVEIRILDNGIGFDDRYKEDIFRLFNQLNRNSPGYGAGLAFCKKIVESHQGKIVAHSIPQKGTVLTITLPLHSR